MNDVPHSELLMVSYHFPPMGTIGTLRNFNFADQASQHFKKVHVISVDVPGIPLQEEFPEIPIVSHPVRNFDYRNFARLFESEQSPFNNRLNASNFTSLVNIFRKVLNSYPSNLWVGEGAPTFAKSAYKKACELISQGQIKYIYTSFRPYTDHHVAYKLKKKFPHLFWIADFRDLHVNEFRDNIFLKNLQVKFNNRILQRADMVTTVSKGLAKHFTAYSSNVYVMRSGISSRISSPPPKEKATHFTISYSGSLHPRFQNATLFLKALQELIAEGKMDPKKVRFIHAGKDFLIWNKWIENHQLQEVFENLGVVSFQQASLLQKKAHINLLLSWSEKKQEGILTGKLYDYLGARKPILLIINGSYDVEFEKLFKDLNAGIISYNQDKFLQATKDFLLQYYEQWLLNDDIEFEPNEANLKEYTWESNFTKFIQHLEKNKVQKDTSISSKKL